jgi:hypothetical protein
MTVDLHKILKTHQHTLLAGLDGAREIFENNEAKGDAVEFEWSELVERFLPSRYQVTPAFVLDCNGECSDFIDVVIHDRHYCPLLFEQGGQKYIPAESVYGVLEVKQALDRGNLIYAAEKAASVRRLKRTSTRIVSLGAAENARPLFEIVSGVLATESSWSPAFGNPFETALRDAATDHTTLDIGCAVRHGGFAVNWKDGEPTLEVSEPESSLMFFLLRLFGALQALGTVPAIDLAEYGRSLEA